MHASHSARYLNEQLIYFMFHNNVRFSTLLITNISAVVIVKHDLYETTYNDFMLDKCVIFLITFGRSLPQKMVCLVYDERFVVAWSHTTATGCRPMHLSF